MHQKYLSDNTTRTEEVNAIDITETNYSIVSINFSTGLPATNSIHLEATK
jgi:hypothetical protein